MAASALRTLRPPPGGRLRALCPSPRLPVAPSAPASPTPGGRLRTLHLRSRPHPRRLRRLLSQSGPRRARSGGDSRRCFSLARYSTAS
ncbi:hypothetical protein GUJ93_ZPchr0010g9563 [Zizania palustris]|uniref:Uncharacterized protein n=1 Tax=Zizania palustris TaxID=103762 RepID=A0A8J5W8Z5_ZIZPA|nr:hypothetical protein GUJ93_ZPchr0010g9563 [Zizania palustris]